MRKKVLDKGFIQLVDRMGNDYSILRSARVSTGVNVVKGEKKDRGLIRYLYKHEHFTPFEQVVFTFHMRSPLFVNQQLLRHRTMAFNQESARYKEFEWDTYTPKEWRTQDTKNKQMSNGIIENTIVDGELTSQMNSAYNKAKNFYDYALQEGVSREIARVTMPMGQYTEIFFTVNFRNLLHFLELRMHSHAQYEIRQYANAIHEILMGLDDIKWTMEIFNEIRDLKVLFSKALDAYKNNLSSFKDELYKLIILKYNEVEKK